MPSSASSVTRRQSQIPAPRTVDAPFLHHDSRTQSCRMSRSRHVKMTHQFTPDRLAFLFGLSVVLAACSTVSGPPLNDSATELRSSTDQKRGLDPEARPRSRVIADGKAATTLPGCFARTRIPQGPESG